MENSHLKDSRRNSQKPNPHQIEFIIEAAVSNLSIKLFDIFPEIRAYRFAYPIRHQLRLTHFKRYLRPTSLCHAKQR